MLILSNYFKYFKILIDNVKYYYENLTNDSRLILYIIIILLFITLILILIMFEQKNLNTKVIKTDITPKENENELEEIDLNEEENEKTKNLKEISDKIQQVLDNRNIDLTEFEREQEENSIISYDELLKSRSK